MSKHCRNFVLTYKYDNMKTQRLQIRIEEELLIQLEKLAESNSLSVSAQVRMLIKHALKNGY